MPSLSGEPNTLTRADHVRRVYTTANGTVKPGVSSAEYVTTYEQALALDHTLGVDPKLAAMTIADVRAACAAAGARRSMPRRREKSHAAAQARTRPRTG
jgi:hypothetical protein